MRRASCQPSSQLMRAFVALDGPDAMACAQSSAGLAVGFERDPESPAAAVTNLPLAEEILRREIGLGRAHLPDPRDIGHGEGLLVAVFEGDYQSALLKRVWIFADKRDKRPRRGFPDPIAG